MSSARYAMQKLRNRRNKWPRGTLATYGPNDRIASKIVVGIITREGASPAAMRTWIATEGDIRYDETVLAEVLAFLEQHDVRCLVTTDRILGCPHQEGIDYHGEHCPDPACAFWVGVDRFTGARVR